MTLLDPASHGISSAVRALKGMGKRSRRNKRAKRVRAKQVGERVPLEKPIGIGVVPMLEDSPSPNGSVGRRYRNIGESPLELAWQRGRLNGKGAYGKMIGDRRFKAGDDFRQWHEATLKAGKSSFEPKVGGASPTARTSLADAQIDAGRFIARVRDAMGDSSNFKIVEAFCGEGYSMVDALRIADIPFSPQGVLPRILEALDVLARVVGKPLPQARRPIDADA